MVESQTPLKERYVLEALRKIISGPGVYRINPGHPSVDLEDMYTYWREGHITIGTWNMPYEELFRDLNDGDAITSEDINPKYKDPVTGGIDQEELTKLLREETTADSPGRAAGSLNRFFNELTEGTGILGNMKGTAPGVVEGPVVYKPEGSAQEAGATHYFVRPVSWAKGPDGGVLEIPTGDLPSSLRPTPTTCTRVQDASDLLNLASFIGFFAEKGNNS